MNQFDSGYNCSMCLRWWLELHIQCLPIWWNTSKWTSSVMVRPTFTQMLMEAIHMR